MSLPDSGECLRLSGTHYTRAPFPLEALGEDLCHVALSHVVFGDSEGQGQALAAGLGVVCATGPAATDWQGTRVLVPAQVPVSDERVATIEPCVMPEGALPVDVACRARWLCPVDEEMGVELWPLVALTGRELLWAYAALIHADLSPGTLVRRPAAGLFADLLSPLLAYRGASLCEADEALELTWNRELAHPDLVPELVTLVARGLLSPTAIPVVRETGGRVARDELAAASPLVIALER